MSEPRNPHDGDDVPAHWFDRWIRPYAAESTLWPVLLVVLAHIAAFVAPAVLFAVRDRSLPAMAALAILIVASGRAVMVDLAERRLGLITALVATSWGLTLTFAFYAHRWNLI
jgi:hypothetical protein